MKKIASSKRNHPNLQNATSVDNLLHSSVSDELFLKYEMEAILEEYRLLFENMNGRLANQQQIINFAITFIAALIALAQFLPNLVSQSLLGYLYLVISIIFSSFALMYLEHDTQVRTIGIYIETYLRPKVQQILSNVSSANLPVWEWEEYRRTSQFHSIKAAPFFFIMSASRFVLTVVPSVVLIIVYWLSRTPGNSISVWESMLFISAIVLAVWMLATIGFVSSLYTRVPKLKADEK